MISFEELTIIGHSSALLCIVLGFLVYHFRSLFYRIGRSVKEPFLRHLSYRPLIHSQHFGLQWSRADVLAEAAYLGLNTGWVYLKSGTLEAAGRRAANMCLGNFIILFIVPQLDALTGALGLQRRTICRLHGSIGVVTALLLVFHIIAAASHVPLPITIAENKWAVVAASSIGAAVLVCIPVIRLRWYEAFLRLHQSLAILSVYGVWVHVAPQRLLPLIHLYVLTGVAGLTLVMLGLLAMYRNGIFGYNHPRATILHSRGAVFIRISVSRPVRVEAGQYISLWMLIPSVRFRSLFQSHPFVVVSWSDRPVYELDLLIEPRAGLTRDLLRISQTKMQPCRALFSGPHGNSIPLADYEVVLMIASGYGIAAQLPYLKQLIHGYNSRRARSRRIHLVWELKTLDLAVATKWVLDNALDEDRLDDGYILQISVYVEDVKKGKHISPRALVIKGLPPWLSIFQAEAEGKLIKRVQEESQARGSMIVTVSACAAVRQELRAIVRNYVHEDVKLVELDYQPHRSETDQQHVYKQPNPPALQERSPDSIGHSNAAETQPKARRLSGATLVERSGSSRRLSGSTLVE